MLKAAILGENLRTFSKSIRLLSKYSTEIRFFIKTNSLILQSINPEKTLFCRLVFAVDFFQQFQTIRNEQNHNDTIEFDCKVDIRSIGLVFKTTCLDKYVNKCEIIIDNSNDQMDFNMECPNRIRQLYSIPIMTSDQYYQRYPVEISQKFERPTLKCDATTMDQLFKSFPLRTENIIMWTFRNYISFKTYYDDENDFKGAMTEFCVPAALFCSNDSSYNYTKDMSLAFCLKELRIFLDFALYRNRIISAYLQPDAKPIEFSFKNSYGCSATIIMATIDMQNTDSQHQRYYHIMRAPKPSEFHSSNRSIITQYDSSGSMITTSLESFENNTTSNNDAHSITSPENPMNDIDQSNNQQTNQYPIINSTVITNSSTINDESTNVANEQISQLSQKRQKCDSKEYEELLQDDDDVDVDIQPIEMESISREQTNDDADGDNNESEIHIAEESNDNVDGDNNESETLIAGESIDNANGDNNLSNMQTLNESNENTNGNNNESSIQTLNESNVATESTDIRTMNDSKISAIDANSNIDDNDDEDNNSDDDETEIVSVFDQSDDSIDLIEKIYSEIHAETTDEKLSMSQIHFLRGDDDGERHNENSSIKFAYNSDEDYDDNDNVTSSIPNGK